MFSFFRVIFILLLPYLLEATPLPTKNIKELIKNSYTKQYPTIKINSIRVTQIAKTPKRFDNFREEEIILSPASLKRNRATLSVLYSSPQKDKKIYFKYQIKATIDLYKANQVIKRGEALTIDNLTLHTTPFQSLLAQPISKLDLNEYSAKRTIKKNRIITTLDIKKSIDIQKNQKVNALISDGELKIMFQATSLQAGNIGDIIKIKRSKNKILRAKIKSKNSVEVVD